MGEPCFAAVMPSDLESTDSYEDFLEANPSDVSNPWPQLVDLRTPRDAWSQPFVRMLFIPTARPDLVFRGINERKIPAIWHVALMHELIGHQLLETPAREWARTALALTYEEIGDLLLGDLSSLGSFHTLNNQFKQACAAIRLPEELLATALSFSLVEGREPDRRDELELWERITVERYDQLLPGQGFANLYFGGFKRAVRGLWGLSTLGPDQDWPLVRLAAFVEPLNLEHKLPSVGDTKRRCELVVEGLSNLHYQTEYENMQHLDGWIRATSEELGDDLSLKIALGLGADYHRRRQARTMGPLFGMVRLGRPPRTKAKTEGWIRDQTKAYWSSPVKLFDFKVLVFPFRYRNGWFVTPWFKKLPKEMKALLVDEALRQQLDERSGIACPVSVLDPEAVMDAGTVTCICDDRFKTRLQGLGNWGLSGKLEPAIGSLDHPTNWHGLAHACD